MAAVDAIAFYVNGQLARVTGRIVNSTTGNTLTGGLADLTAHRMIDGDTAFATTGLTIAERGTTGWFDVDIDSTRMTSNTIILEVRSTTANAMYWAFVLRPLDLSETFTGHWLSHTIKKFERGIIQACGYLVSKVKRNKNSGLITAYHRGTFSGGVETEGALIGTMDYSDDGTDVVKGTIEAP